MPGRATCEECFEDKLSECATCPMPEGLLEANEKAFEIWRFSRKCGKGLGVTGFLSIVSSLGGTKTDLEKVLEIMAIDERLNGDKTNG